MAEQQSTEKNNISQPSVGLATDIAVGQLKNGYITDALNANIQTTSGEEVSYSNDDANEFCFSVPSGYKVIGVKNLIQLNKVLYFLANPTTNHSQIGYVQNNNCIYIPLLDDSVTGSDLLMFNINYPIHKVEVKTTNCSTQFYFTDNLNDRRFVDLENLPWKVIGGVIQVGNIDTNKMKIQPHYSIPTITPVSIETGGNIVEGTYQFAICYSNSYSNQMTPYHSVTNPIRVFLDYHVSPDFNLVTNKSIHISIDNLDITRLYSYFNLAVIKTINAIVTVDLVGTFSIQQKTFTHTYTGEEQSNANIKLTISDILEQFTYYSRASIVCQADQTLIWAGLTKEDDLNYQKIWNQVKVYWQTSKMVYRRPLAYFNGVNCAKFEGFHRDEVYPLEGCFIHANGKEGVRCHIPGRLVTPADLIPVSNQDAISIETGECPTPVSLPKWKVYNTGSNLGFFASLVPIDPCEGVTPYEHGLMSYWESTELYPNKPEVWGPLANTPIRHHCFPDCSISPIHDGEGNVYPIGFLIDTVSLYNAIQTSPDLTQTQKNDIVGFKIMRGERGPNKRIVAKGLLFNCGQYDKEGNSFYYANYPFNDVRPDSFISDAPVENKSGSNSGSRLTKFQKNRFTFHSPDTHFYQPTGIEGSFLKFETVESGTCTAHFVPVSHNAGEKLRTITAVEIALIAGFMSTVGINIATEVGSTDTTTFSPTFNIHNFFPSYNAMLEILDKLTPYSNYAWQYNGIGNYTNSNPVSNSGSKVRYINFGGYLLSGLQDSFGDNLEINNSFRESSVYISTDVEVPFTHLAGTGYTIPDSSRMTAVEAGVPQTSTHFTQPISSYYGSIKRNLPDQYGVIFSYNPIDTGVDGRFFDDNGNPTLGLLQVYGGDIFINQFALKIKHSFYLNKSVGLADGSDVNYNQDDFSKTETGNIGYPIWYYSTMNKPYIMGPLTHGALVNFENLITGQAFGAPPNLLTWLLTAIVFVPFAMLDMLELFTGLLTDGFFLNLGLKITNLESYNGDDIYEKGQAYQYAYGIINFYVESEVNVDMRQASDSRAGDFVPNIGTGIPDNWLQEINVPIANDNSYNYNKTFSKQNKETFFPLLRPDWEPNQVCYTNYPNTAVWSEKSSMEEVANHWLIYRPSNFFDFEKGDGNMVSMDSIDIRAVLVRYENAAEIHNAMSTIATNNVTAVLGTGRLFSETPLRLSDTDNNYSGTQNKFFLSTEHGHIYVNASGAEIMLLKGSSLEILTSAKYLNSKLFRRILPFQLLSHFPNCNIDNAFNGIGITGVYDSYYERLIITKIDYIPAPGLHDYTLNYDGTNFYITYALGIKTQEKIIVQLTDPTYFTPAGFTVSFSFLTNSWVSFHSFQPNFYVEYEDYFQAGLNNDLNSNNNCTIWNHNDTYSLYSSYFGVQVPYVLELPFIYKSGEQILQSVSVDTMAIKYADYENFTELNGVNFFNKCVVYNTTQCSGIRNLIPKGNNLSVRYPQYHTDSIDITVVKTDNLNNFNMIWDIVKDQTQPMWTGFPKVLNQSNMNYVNNQSYKKYPLRSRESKVRLIMDNSTTTKLLTRFSITKTQESIV